jgi:hypothetical protein
MLERLMYHSPTITGVLIPTDRVQEARNHERIEECKARMGEKYLLHPANRVKKGSAQWLKNP